MGSSPPAKNLQRGPVAHAQPPDQGWGRVSQISQEYQCQGTPWRPFHLPQPALTATSLSGSSQVLDSADGDGRGSRGTARLTLMCKACCAGGTTRCPRDLHQNPSHTVSPVFPGTGREQPYSSGAMLARQE